MIYLKTSQNQCELMIPDHSKQLKKLETSINSISAQVGRINMYLNPLMYYEKDADEIVGTWIDGQNIHRRVFTREFKDLHFQNSGTDGKTAVWQIDFNQSIRDMIKMDVMSSSTPGFVGQYCDPCNSGNWGIAGDYLRVFFHRTEKNMYVTCGDANPPRPFKLIVIMYYTII